MKSITGWGKYHEGGGSMTCPNCIYWNSEYRRKVACHLCRDTRLISKRPELNSGNGTNSSGFTGLPSGIRIYGHFDYIGTRAFWWISSGMTTGLSQKDPALMTFYSFPEFFEKANGCSVRCIKD